MNTQMRTEIDLNEPEIDLNEYVNTSLTHVTVQSSRYTLLWMEVKKMKDWQHFTKLVPNGPALCLRRVGGDKRSHLEFKDSDFERMLVTKVIDLPWYFWNLVMLFSENLYLPAVGTGLLIIVKCEVINDARVSQAIWSLQTWGRCALIHW